MKSLPRDVDNITAVEIAEFELLRITGEFVSLPVMVGYWDDRVRQQPCYASITRMVREYCQRNALATRTLACPKGAVPVESINGVCALGYRALSKDADICLADAIYLPNDVDGDLLSKFTTIIKIDGGSAVRFGNGPNTFENEFYRRHPRR
jgi:hypothetical protein